MPYIHTSITRLSLVAAAALVGSLAFAGPAHASPITAGFFDTLTLNAATIQAQMAMVTDSGSLGLRFDNHVHGTFDLDVDMCNLKGANGLLCTGVDPTPPNHEFSGGSTVIEGAAAAADMAVPEPATLVLLGTGLLGAVRAVKGRARKR